MAAKPELKEWQKRLLGPYVTASTIKAFKDELGEISKLPEPNFSKRLYGLAKVIGLQPRGMDFFAAVARGEGENYDLLLPPAEINEDINVESDGCGGMIRTPGGFTIYIPEGVPLQEVLDYLKEEWDQILSIQSLNGVQPHQRMRRRDNLERDLTIYGLRNSGMSEKDIADLVTDGDLQVMKMALHRFRKRLSS